MPRTRPLKTYVIRIQRRQSKRLSDSVLQKTVEYFVERGISDTGMAAEGWVLQEWRQKEPYPEGEFLVLTVDLLLDRSGKEDLKGQPAKQLEKIKAAIERAGVNTAKFGHQAWTLSEPDAVLPRMPPKTNPPASDEDDPETLAYSMTQGGIPDVVLRPSEINFPEHLLDASDSDLEAYPYFHGIYERGPQIRLLMGAMNDAILTNFESPAHVLLFGTTGVAKTVLLKRIRTMLGNGAVLWINCPSATKAGVEWLFLKKFRDTCPPFIVLEETDKIATDVLNVLLPALDEERRITKHQHGNDDAVEFKSMVIGTCNNKRKMDAIQGGAFVSRFGLQLYCPRPNPATMRRILLDKIAKRGGDPSWADRCVEMMELFRTNDPRRVQSWLTGRERLDGRFQGDLEAVHKAYTEDADMMMQLAMMDREERFSDREIALQQVPRMALPPSPNGRKKR